MNTQTLVSSKPSIVHVLKGTWRGVVHMWWFLFRIQPWKGQPVDFSKVPTDIVATYRFEADEDLGREARAELLRRGYKQDWTDYTIWY